MKEDMEDQRRESQGSTEGFLRDSMCAKTQELVRLIRVG